MSGEPPTMERENSAREVQEEIVEKEQATEKRKEEIMRFGVPEDQMQETPLPNTPEMKYRSEQTDIIMKRVMELPFEIKAHEAKLFALTQKDDYINKRSNEIRERTYVNVFNETLPGEQRFPDIASQEKETHKRLQNTKLWAKKWAEIYQRVATTAKEAPEGEIPKILYTSEASRKAETTKRIYKDPEIKAENGRIMTKVYQEKLERRQAFTNDKIREIEVNNRLHVQEEYVQLMSEQKTVVAETHKTKADIYCLRGEFKSIEIVTELMKIKLRII